MRVLHLTTHLDPGGITQYILKLGRPLQELGCSLFILSGGGSHLPEFEAAGFTCYTLCIRTKSELHPKLYTAIPSIIRLLRKERIEVIHAHNRPSQVLAQHVSSLTQIPYITTCHGFYKRRLGRAILPAWGKRVIAISEGVKEHLLVDFKVASEKVRVVPNGIDIEDLRSRVLRVSNDEAKAFFGFAADSLVLCCIARLVAVKGQSGLIRAFARVRSHVHNLRLLLVGEGEERTAYEELAKELGVKDSTVFAGNMQDISTALAASDIFAHPATWKEAFGLSIIEAMAAGKPVIVSDNWALLSSFDKNMHVMTVPPNDVTRLASAIEKAAADEAFRTSMGEAGYAVVKDKFSITQTAAGIHSVYKETLTP